MVDGGHGEELPPLAGPLAVLDDQARAALVAAGSWRRFQPGEFLMRQGGASRALYVLAEGRVRVVMSTADGDELLVAVLGPGQAAGELSVLDGQPRSATVIALEPVRALRVEGNAFGRFLLSRPALVVGMLRVLSGRLRDADELRLQLSVTPAEQRLARCLLELAADHGQIEAAGIRITLRLSQADLASYVGTSREAVNQILGRFRDGGLVATARQSITILDLEGLRVRAGG